MILPSDRHPVILFDGLCNLCDRSVQFVIRHDPKKIFRFASLQSDYGRSALQRSGLSPDAVDTIVLVDGNVSQKSTAALRIARRLSGAWPAFYFLMIVPKFLRDWVYDGVARNRYRLFGKKDACMIPEPGVRERFLE